MHFKKGFLLSLTAGIPFIEEVHAAATPNPNLMPSGVSLPEGIKSFFSKRQTTIPTGSGPKARNLATGQIVIAPEYVPQFTKCQNAEKEENEYSSSVANWRKQDIDEWLTYWWASQDKKKGGLVEQLWLQFTGKRLSDKGNCNYIQSGACVSTECSDILFSEKDHTKAYVVLNSIRRLIETLKYNHRALDMGTWDASVNKDHMIQLFSFDGSLKQPDNSFLAKGILNGLATLIGMALAAPLGPAAPIAGAFMAGVGTQVGMFIENEYGSKDQDPNPFRAQAKLGEFLITSTQAARNVLQALIDSLLGGEPFSQGGVKMNLGAWLQDGIYTTVDLSGLSKQMPAYYSMAMAGQLLNALWKWDSTYIIADKAGHCARENNNHGVIYCDPNEPEYTYYLVGYGLTGSPWPQMIEPRGWTKFNEVAQFNNAAYPANKVTHQEVMISSINHWKRQKKRNAIITDPNFMLPIEFQSQLVNSLKLGSKTPGIFTIPVCENVGGKANIVTQIRTDNKRRYPCTCAGDSWGNPVGKKTGPTFEFLTASSFILPDSIFHRDDKIKQFCDHGNQDALVWPWEVKW